MSQKQSIGLKPPTTDPAPRMDWEGRAMEQMLRDVRAIRWYISAILFHQAATVLLLVAFVFAKG